MSPTFASLRVRNYRLFWTGGLVSNTGTWMQRVAQDWLVLQLSHGSGTALGLVTALQFLPTLLFGLPGGLVADRYPKRRTLMIAQVSFALTAAVLGVLVLTGAVRLWQVMLVAFALGASAAVEAPTRQAFVTEMVGADDLANAVGLNSASFNAGRILGPALAGIMIAAWGTGAVFLVNAASYLAVLAGLALMDPRRLHVAAPSAGGSGALRRGLAYVVGDPVLAATVVLVLVVATFGLNFQITTALMATHVFGVGARSYGLLGSALAVGSLLGALLAARRGAVRLGFVLAAAAAFGVAEIVVGLMPTYLTFALLLVPTGLAALTFTTSALSTVQTRSDPRMRGRVMSIYLLVFMGGAPAGSLVVGWVAQHVGVRWAIVGGGAASVLAALAVCGWIMHRTRVRVVPALRPRPHLQVRPAAAS